MFSNSALVAVFTTLNIILNVAHAAQSPVSIHPHAKDQSRKGKDTIQQIQIAVVQQPPPQSVQGPSTPGDFIWVQLPSSTLQTQRPAIVQPAAPPPFLPPVIEGDALNQKCLKPRGQFPGNSCDKYVNCWDGIATEQSCPEGLLFSSRGYCDYPANVNCNGNPTPAPGQSSTSTTPASATLAPVDPNLRKKCLRPRGQFPSDSCSKYVNCWDDVIVEQECPEGLLFSQKGYCDYPQQVNCEDRVAPPRSGGLVAPDVECLRDYGTFRDRVNCSNYYTCIGGKIAATYTCPEGYSFNDNIGVCDVSERVDCKREPLIFNPKTNFLQNVPTDFMRKIDTCKPGSVIRLNPECTVACLCRDGISEIIECPPGLAYDSIMDKCVLPYLAQC